MPLTSAQVNCIAQFTLSRANSGFNPARSNNNSVNFTLTGLNIGTFNQVYAATLSIAALASTTIDLTSLTNLVQESFGLGHALVIALAPVGATVTLTPGASNGLVWFFSGTTGGITLSDGGFMLYSEPVAGPGHVVDSTHKTLTFTAGSAGTLTLTVFLLGSTT